MRHNKSTQANQTDPDVRAARALGYASLAIAATEIIGQGTVEEDCLGVDDHPDVMVALGAREALAGITLLSQKSITPTLAAGLWSRVAGDVMDLALLGVCAGTTRKPANLLATTLMVAGITAADVYYAYRVQKRLMKPTKEPRAAYPDSVEESLARVQALSHA